MGKAIILFSPDKCTDKCWDYVLRRVQPRALKSSMRLEYHLFHMNKSVNPIWIQEKCLPDFCFPAMTKRCKRYGGVVGPDGFCLLRADKNRITVNKRFYVKLTRCICSVECFGMMFNCWCGLLYIIQIQMLSSVGVGAPLVQLLVLTEEPGVDRIEIRKW